MPTKFAFTSAALFGWLQRSCLTYSTESHGTPTCCKTLAVQLEASGLLAGALPQDLAILAGCARL